MKYISSWSSEYRKKKFYQNQQHRLTKNDESHDLFKKSKERSIAVMLDLEGVTDDIDKEGASIFVRELDFLRRKFAVKYCYICISTHSRDSSKVKRVLDILSDYTTKNIIIGKCFLYGSTYDYETDTINNQGAFFNSKKIATFKSYYLNNYITNNVWFMIADDTLSNEVYIGYQNIHPCLFIKPGSSEFSNFMSICTETKGFDGLIEALDRYIQSIKKLTLVKVLDEQKNMICHLSGHYLIEKIRNHEYNYLIRYFEEGYADEADYYDTITWLGFSNSESPEDIPLITRLLSILKSHITEEKGKMLICSLEEKLGIK